MEAKGVAVKQRGIDEGASKGICLTEGRKRKGKGNAPKKNLSIIVIAFKNC